MKTKTNTDKLTPGQMRAMETILQSGGLFWYETHMGNLKKRGGARKVVCHKLIDMGMLEITMKEDPDRQHYHGETLYDGTPIETKSEFFVATARGCKAYQLTRLDAQFKAMKKAGLVR